MFSDSNLFYLFFNVRQSLSVKFGFCPLFLFADVFPYFLHAVNTVDTVACGLLQSSAGFVKDVEKFRPLSKLEGQHISPLAWYDRRRGQCLLP